MACYYNAQCASNRQSGFASKRDKTANNSCADIKKSFEVRGSRLASAATTWRGTVGDAPRENVGERGGARMLPPQAWCVIVS